MGWWTVLRKKLVNLGVNKRGNMFDTILIGIVLFAFAMITIISIGFFKNVETELLADGSLTTNESKEALSTVNAGMPIWFDNAILFLFAGLIIATLISAFFIDSSPIFFVFGFIILILGGVVWVVVEETANDIITSDESYVNVTNLMPNTSFLMNNYLKIMIAIPFLVMVLLFAKGRLNQGGGGF